MPNRNAWLTPDSIPTETVCRTLVIPAEFEEIYSAVSGALYPLTLAENWEQFGSVTPEQIASAMLIMYLAFLDSECDAPMALPIGTMVDFGADTVPDLWLPCDGTTRLRANYPDLFAVIGTTYGFNDGTDFALPDCQNKSTYGLEYTDPTPARPVGFEDGTELVTLSVAQLPAHQHTTVDGSLYEIGTIGGAGLMLGATNSFPTVKTGSTGSNTPHSNLHPILVVGKIIYAGV